MDPIKNIYRKNDLKAMKQIHGCLLKGSEIRRIEKRYFPYAFNVWFCLLILAIMLIGGCLLSRPVHADKIIMKGYNSEEICEAIRHAEGVNSKYPYGIKSVSCSNQNECKDVCIKTIRHYRKDFKKHDARRNEDFIEYASKRYVAGDTRKSQENWVKNVKYFLRKKRS